MKPSRALGILSVLFFVAAVLTIALPAASVVVGSLRCGTGCVSANQLNLGSGQFPTYLSVTNRGFLPLDGVSIDVLLTSPSGSQISSVTLGPVDIPAGATVPLNVVLPSAAAALQLNASTFVVKATGRANLAGLIPITFSADFTVTPGNGTGALPTG